MEKGLSKNEIIQQLARSTHRDLKLYVPTISSAAKYEPEFLAHLISWNRVEGSVRDSQVALPVISLNTPAYNAVPEFVDNSLAHLASLDPRRLVQALDFGPEIGLPRNHNRFRRLVEQYLHIREEHFPWFERGVLQHRKSFKRLYSFWNVKPGRIANNVLFKGQYPEGSTLALVPQLPLMDPKEAAGTILERGIPFLIATSVLGKKLQHPDLLLALIEKMSPNELVNNTAWLEKMGMKASPILSAAYREGLKRVVESTGVKTTSARTNALKTGKAIERVQSEGLRTQLKAVQAKQIKNVGVEGDWLILADRSPSMKASIEISRWLGATLAGLVKGKVMLIYFDSGVSKTVDVTGMDLDMVQRETRYITAGGSGTCIGAGLAWALDRKMAFNGIAIVSDGGERQAPQFHDVYEKYCKKMDLEPPVYLYLTEGDTNYLGHHMAAKGIPLETFDLKKTKVDYYSVLNLAQTMSVKRYGLLDKIMDTPLLTLDGVFAEQRKEHGKSRGRK